MEKCIHETAVLVPVFILHLLCVFVLSRRKVLGQKSTYVWSKTDWLKLWSSVSRPLVLSMSLHCKEVCLGCVSIYLSQNQVWECSMIMQVYVQQYQCWRLSVEVNQCGLINSNAILSNKLFTNFVRTWPKFQIASINESEDREVLCFTQSHTNLSYLASVPK